MARKRKLTAADLAEAKIVSEASHFTASQFKGRGVYDTRECDTLADAERIAAAMLAASETKRPVMVYAVTAEGRSWPLKCVA
jgi:hypothetical protein